MRETLAHIDRLSQDRHQPHLIVTPNIAHVQQARRFPALRQAYERASLSTPDGWPVLLAVRLLSRRHDLRRVTGADLVPELLNRPYRVMVAGGSPGSAQRLVAGVMDAETGCTAAFEPLPREEVDDDERRKKSIERIKDFHADVVLVGIGVPKQEVFSMELLDKLDAGVVVTVGAAIDFASGHTTRCPHFLQRMGLEWFYRVVREPRRLAGRYAVAAPYFLGVVLGAAFREVWRDRVGSD